LNFSADLQGVTGVVLEVLPDPTLPQFGPGRSKDGNFVLNEILFSHALPAKPGELKSESFSGAWASHSQDKFPVAAAIDGKEDDAQNGWAIGGATSRRQMAVFQFNQPVKEEGARKITIKLQQKMRESDQIGRFRIYLTKAVNPLGEGLPEAVLAVVSKPAAERTPADKALLTGFVKTADVEYWRQSKELADAKTPLVADPKYTELKAALATANEPIKLDPVLVQLRIDAEASQKQVGNKRLTVVQDLTWALINNPAFLFNR
jgi:hypothetical protein